MVDACRIDDSGKRVEAVAIERRGCLIQSLVIEHLGELALVEVAADDRDGMDRGSRRHAQVAQRRDEAAPRGVGERQVVDRRGEDVGDLLGNQLLGRGHADVDRLREGADRRARLLAERRVRLVGDHELVRVARERADVPREPRVGLDRHGVAAERLAALLDRRREPVAVPLGLELAVELRDEQAAVREDQDAERPRRLDEAGGRDGLPGSGRMAEAVAALRTRVFLEHELRLLVLRLLLELEVVFLLLRLDLRQDCAVAVQLGLLLVRRDQLRQHSRQRVDLVPPQLGSGGEARRLVGQDPLEPEHQAVAHLPARRRALAAGLHLAERVVECATARGAGREDALEVLAGVEKRFACPRLGTAGKCCKLGRRGRRKGQVLSRFVHMRSTEWCCCLSQRSRSPKRRASRRL